MSSVPAVRSTVNVPLDSSCAVWRVVTTAGEFAGAADALGARPRSRKRITGEASPRRNPVSRSWRRLSRPARASKQASYARVFHDATSRLCATPPARLCAQTGETKRLGLLACSLPKGGIPSDASNDRATFIRAQQCYSARMTIHNCPWSVADQISGIWSTRANEWTSSGVSRASWRAMAPPNE